jgi:hypothetical protein
MVCLPQGNGGGIGTGNTFAPDRTNNVEQVAVSYLPAGDIAIEVCAAAGFPQSNMLAQSIAIPLLYPQLMRIILKLACPL